jgi:hypothetical protein
LTEIAISRERGRNRGKVIREKRCGAAGATFWKTFGAVVQGLRAGGGNLKGSNVLRKKIWGAIFSTPNCCRSMPLTELINFCRNFPSYRPPFGGWGGWKLLKNEVFSRILENAEINFSDTSPKVVFWPGLQNAVSPMGRSFLEHPQNGPPKKWIFPQFFWPL